jgi:hypothetical protein
MITGHKVAGNRMQRPQQTKLHQFSAVLERPVWPERTADRGVCQVLVLIRQMSSHLGRTLRLCRPSCIPDSLHDSGPPASIRGRGGVTVRGMWGRPRAKVSAAPWATRRLASASL